MTAVVVGTIVVGLGAWGMGVGLRPRPRRRRRPQSQPNLGQHAVGAVVPGHGTRGRPLGRWRRVEAEWSTLARAVVEGRPEVVTALDRWLWLVDQEWDELMAGQVRTAVLAAFGTLAGIATAVVVGVGVNGVVAAVAVGLAAVGGAALPVIRLRRQAARQAEDAVEAVSTYADLVVLCLAGGMGIESALQAAATVANDPLTQRIGRVLASAADAGRSPWGALASLGEALGVDALVDLAGAVALAGTEGAAVRATLAARAATLRARHQAAVEARANAVTERLFVPGVVLLLGFLVFIGYPAVARILTGF